MKKKLLFVMESLRIGGAEKSLVTLLSMIDTEQYDVDLFLFKHNGEFLSQLPEKVNLLDVDKHVLLFSSNFKSAWIKYLLHEDVKRSIFSLKWFIECFFSKFVLKKSEYYGWNNQKHIYSKLNKHYDVAIGFLEKKSTYFVVDMVNADKKFAFMHTDYDAIPHDEKLDTNYYKQLHGLAVVSEHTGDTMLSHFPFMKGKIHVIKNMVSPDVIKSMAQESATEMDTCARDTVKICTVGRLTRQKNIDGAVKILFELRKKNIDAEWFVIGDGEERKALEQQIREYHLEGKFHLLGSKSNPYPYIQNADIYVQPSRWEGYGITVAEAKVLCKPIVTSDIPEFREQIKDQVTGVIVSEIDSYVNEIIELMIKPEKAEMFKNMLANEKCNMDELYNFYSMIEG